MISINGYETSNGNDSNVSRKPGILIVDNMGLILTLLKFELEPRGFTVWLAMDGDDALDLYGQNHAEIDIVLLDAQTPGLDGPQVLARMQEIVPDVLACFMTRHPGPYSKEELLDCGAVCVFRKPFSPQGIGYVLKSILDSGRVTKPTGDRARRHVLLAPDGA